MEKTLRYKLSLEAMWWLATAIIVGLVMYPILSATTRHPAPWQNIAYIVAAVTFSRYLFLLPTTLIAKNQRSKVIFMFICLPLIPVFWVWLTEFRSFIDERNVEDLLPDVMPEDHAGLLGYLNSEMIFFCMAAIISAILLPIRLVISLWRTYNRGTV